MRNKFTITISDVKGSRHYTIDDIIKRVIAIFLIFIALLFAGGVIYITVLNHKVEQLDNKKNELQSELDDKIAYYEVIKSKIEEIESIIGIVHEEDDNTTHEARLSNITLTTVQQSLLLQFIPNGEVAKHNGLSDKFGMRKHPIRGTDEFHSGLDFRTPLQTPIYAPALGIVEYAGNSESSGYGFLVIVDHGFGFKSYYAHLDKKMVVKVGQFVKKGDHIANSGNTGLSSGPHLHYEVRFLGRALNPINFVNWDLNNFSQIFEKETNVQWDSLLEVMSILLANKQNQQ
ncbi:MAG: M23 family metallopeptidase [Campylobacteraceae bacterium]|jgi:murein DD-endopeptidase MepM/ murein hydrolase activator NlpD|nr:M23 family metallopeptidase [Campylobacteraceae bacterium]